MIGVARAPLYRVFMRADANQLKRFYATSLGLAAARSIETGLSRVWRTLPNERLVGLGYTLPWLKSLGVDAERTLALMPSEQGARRWPHDTPGQVALVDEEELPLAEASVDRVLAVHLLEHSEQPIETLREIHRVLAANGRVVVVVPHRRGVWARLETTPFGTGRPWSRGQLEQAMTVAGFHISDVNDALLFAPIPHRWFGPLARPSDWVGRKLFSAFSGAIIAVGAKGETAGTPAEARLRRRPVEVPALVPQTHRERPDCGGPTSPRLRSLSF